MYMWVCAHIHKYIRTYMLHINTCYGSPSTRAAPLQQRGRVRRENLAVAQAKWLVTT